MVSQKLHGDFDLTSCHLSINVGYYISLYTVVLVSTIHAVQTLAGESR